MGNLRVDLGVCPYDLGLAGGPLDRLNLDGGELGGEDVAPRSSKLVHRLTTGSICSIFVNEADFNKGIGAQDLDPDQGLGINGLQDPFDGVMDHIWDGDLEEGISILIQTSDNARGLTLLVDCLDVLPRPDKRGVLAFRNISEFLMLVSAQIELKNYRSRLQGIQHCWS